MENKLSVIIVDDFEMARIGMRHMLKGISTVGTIREAKNSKELFILIKSEEPDIIFMDIQLGDENGVEITKQVLLKYPDTYILAITASKEVRYFSEMRDAGAVGFLFKSVTHVELEKAIDEVVIGNMCFSKELVNLADKLVPKKIKKPTIKLSNRECQVLKLICLGNSNQKIASELKLSLHTINTHRKHLLHKIGAKNTASMIMISIKDGIIDID